MSGADVDEMAPVLPADDFAGQVGHPAGRHGYFTFSSSSRAALPPRPHAASPAAVARILRPCYLGSTGWVAERFKAPVLKTGGPPGPVGSNPTPSAMTMD